MVFCNQNCSDLRSVRKKWFSDREKLLKFDAEGQRDSIIGGPDTAIILWKPNKSLFEGSTSVGIHGQKICLLFRLLDF